MHRRMHARGSLAWTARLFVPLLAFSILAGIPDAALAVYPKVFHLNLNPNPGSAADLARYAHVAYSYRAPLSLRTAVRSANPSSIDFAWISAISVSATDYYGLMKTVRDSANAYNWWVYRSDGTHALSWCADGVDNEWVLDMSDNCPRSRRGERFRDWYARTLVDSLVVGRRFSGLVLDQCHVTIYWLRDYQCNPEQLRLDLNRDGIGDADSTVTRQWSLGIYDFLRQIRQRVGPGYPVLCNGAVNLVYDNGGKRLSDFLNGSMLECFLFMPPLHTDLRNNLFNINRGYFPEQAAVQPLNGQRWMIIGDSGPCMRLTGDDLMRQKRLTLGGCLLGDAYYTRPTGEENEWQPEYDLCLGEPLGPADSLGGGTQGVWVREFTNGFVAVNPNDSPVVVPGRLVTVPARDAAIVQDPLDRVADLTAAIVYPEAVQFRFTVSGDASGCSVPSSCSLTAIDPGGVSRVWTTPVTAPVGSFQYVNATFLNAGTRYRFSIVTNKSGFAPSAPSDTILVMTPGGTADVFPPAAIQNLSSTKPGPTRFTVVWTAPADPPLGGAAARYEMRFWRDSESWATGTVVDGLPRPGSPGMAQSIVLRNLLKGTRYHVQIRSCDYSGNWSALSNEAFGWTLPQNGSPAASLEPMVPNPFSGTTQVRFTLPEEAFADVSIFDPDGSLVKTLSSGALAAGTFVVLWDGTDSRGRSMPGGVYLCRFTTPGVQVTRKLVLLRK